MYYVATAVNGYFTHFVVLVTLLRLYSAIYTFPHYCAVVSSTFTYFTHFLVLRVTLLCWLYLLISHVSILLRYYGFSCFLIKGKGCTPLYVHFLIHSMLLRYYNCTRLCTIYLDLVTLPRLFIGLSISEVG